MEQKVNVLAKARNYLIVSDSGGGLLFKQASDQRNYSTQPLAIDSGAYLIAKKALSWKQANERAGALARNKNIVLFSKSK